MEDMNDGIRSLDIDHIESSDPACHPTLLLGFFPLCRQGHASALKGRVRAFSTISFPWIVDALFVSMASGPAVCEAKDIKSISHALSIVIRFARGDFLLK